MIFTPVKTGMINENHQKHLLKFGRHLEELRKKKNLSLRKLSQNCDVEYADIKRYENGEINMTFLTLIELAKGLDITVNELMDY
jgi:transcriptional regulator with XRE-family HTH domain